jgi:hypothetical protein
LFVSPFDSYQNGLGEAHRRVWMVQVARQKKASDLLRRKEQGEWMSDPSGWFM